MSLFGGRTGQESRERTPEEREQARLEREARRRARSGEIPPPFDYHGAPSVRRTAEPPLDYTPSPNGEEGQGAALAEPPPPEPPRDLVEEEPPIASPSPLDEEGDPFDAPFPLVEEESGAMEEPVVEEGPPAVEGSVVEEGPPAVEGSVVEEGPPAPEGELVEEERPAAEESVVGDSPTPDGSADGDAQVAVEPQPTEAHDALGEVAAEEAAEQPAATPAGPPSPSASVTRFRRDGTTAPRRRRRAGIPPRQPRTAATTPKEPREPGGVRRWALRIAAPLALILVLFVGWFLISLYQPFTGGGGAPVRVKIPNGSTAREIGNLLADRGVVSSGFFFALNARLNGNRSDLKAGTYTFRKGMKFTDAQAIMTKGPPPIRTVTLRLPEGNTERDFASAVDKSGKLRGKYMSAVRRARFNPRRYGAPAGSPLEGFLFPATYELRKGRQATAQNLVNQQLATFKRSFGRVSMRKARRARLTQYEVLIIASMIEREASVGRERPVVASVIYNRLKQGIPLGIDATIRYATNNWTRPIRESELRAPGPYNTRLNQGLPPTAIGNPSLASIRAAANPRPTNYLYFVVKPCGNGQHAFSSSYQQFLADQSRYSSARTANGGRDPSKC